MIYTLTRITSGYNGTLGAITDETGHELCKTCERPPTGPHPCVPEGTYTFELYASPTKGQVWITQDVPGRSDIEIHAGNDENDSLGCILVGDRYGTVDDLPAVLDSRATLISLRHILPHVFHLQIINNIQTIN